MEIKLKSSESAESKLRKSEPKLDEQIDDYIFSLHDISDSSKEQYSTHLKIFACYLVDKGITNFNEVKKTDLGRFLSSKNKASTRNKYIFVITRFYKEYLGKKKLVEDLHQRRKRVVVRRV